MQRLLNWLWNHLLFAGTMFFAAGAVADAGAAGGGDGGAGADAGDTGGGSGAGTDGGGAGADADGGDGSQDSGADAGGEDGTGAGAADGTGSDPEALVAGEDGRFIPAKYKEIFKANRELQDIYVAQRFFKQEFPGGLKEARGYKAQVEKLGGESGIREVQEESTYLRDLDKAFLARDPKVLDTLVEADKDSTVELILHGIDKLAALAPEQYDYTLGGIVFSTVNNAQAFHDAFNVLQALKDNPQAQEAAKALKAWYNSMREIAQKKPEKKGPDSRLTEVERRQAALDQREHDHRVETVNSTVRPQLVSSIEKALAQEMKALGRDAAKLKAANPKLYNRILANAMQEVKARVLGDETFKANYQTALINEKNPQKAIKMATAKNAKVVQAAVRDVWAEFAGLVEKTKPGTGGGGTNTDKSKNAGGGNAEQGFKRVAKMPDRWTIDWNKSERMIIDRKAILKDGSKVQWD